MGGAQDEGHTCQHLSVSVLNPWELLRKYVCASCDAVMTCRCDADLAIHVLPHQAGRGVHPHSQDPVPVTVPLALGVCFRCRGEAPPPFPKSPHRGATSVVHRYYWHELWTQSQQGFIDWCRTQGHVMTDQAGRSRIADLRRSHSDALERIESTVLSALRELHARSPLYDTSRVSDNDLLLGAGVRISRLHAAYLTPSPGPKAMVLPVGATDPALATSVEDFAAQHFRQLGFEVMKLESRPLQCLYGCLMWMWVSGFDPETRLVFFGGREGAESDENGLIPTWIPRDFGTANHSERRRDSLIEHLNFLPDDTGELLWVYDYWLDPSRTLRQYLWAYTEVEEVKARELIRVLGAKQVKRVLRFLADDYWERYLGWPDLLIWRERNEPPMAPTLSSRAGASGYEARFVEVKSSRDRLSDDQRAWMRLNHEVLNLPAEVLKVHRAERVKVEAG